MGDWASRVKAAPPRRDVQLKVSAEDDGQRPEKTFRAFRVRGLGFRRV